MDKFGLIGDPIYDSLSPALFTAGYNGKYDYDLIKEKEFVKAFQKFTEGYKAINVTAPFKQDAFLKADIFTSSCNKIGASNILIKTKNGVKADNSDFTGIVLSIVEAMLPGLTEQFYAKFGSKAFIRIHQFFLQSIDSLFSRKPQALIVGCGGAGRAAAVAAAELGFDTVLMNRTEEKAGKIAMELPEYGFIVDPISDFEAAFKECDLVIYTLPMTIPALENLTANSFAGEDRYTYNRPSKVILEANYKNPSFSGNILDMLNASGCQYVSGRKWLLYQALTGYGIMTGEEPDLKAMTEVMI
jgi:shikimate 5-dehydrogenase